MSASVVSFLGRLMPLRRFRRLFIWSGAVFAALILFAFFWAASSCKIISDANVV